MADADRGIELYPLTGVGRCLYCNLDVLAALDAEPGVGTDVVCGGCAGLHVLWTDGDGWPRLRKPTAAERLEILKRPAVQAVRDAYLLDQVEARMTRSSQKDKRPPAPRTAGRARLGQNRLEAKGPDA